ncbi:MAG: AAA family ATPase [Bacillota bacterium]
MAGLPLKIVEPLEQERENLARILEARAWLQRHLAETRTTRKAVAKALDYNESTISQFLGTPDEDKRIPGHVSKYPGDELAVAMAIESYRDLAERRAVAPRVPGYVETSFTEEVKAVLGYCHINRDLGICYSGAGRGKTMAISDYLSSHPDCILITADPCLRSPNPLLEELLDKLGKSGGSNARKARRLVIESLRDSGRMVIVDEAQHLTPKGIDILRILIVDQAHCGLALIGNELVYDRLHGRARAEFAQLSSRVGIRRCLQREIPLSDIRKVIESVVTVTDDCLDFLLEQARGNGGFRTVVKLFKMGCDIAGANGRPALDVESLRFATRFLMPGEDA